LTVIQKVDVFEYAIEGVPGDDLKDVLWLKSRNSEVWLERRTNYTRSLAVMSMVGYILGLGDRHPSNVMIERVTGKVLHIDFGDCFEVAMQREKYPEKIPFRLTRMLVKAMEVSGIEGNFRFTCDNIMRVMRENKESMMAVLEAFVYDPLINWRLFNQKEVSPEKNEVPEKMEEVTEMETTVDSTDIEISTETTENESDHNGESSPEKGDNQTTTNVKTSLDDLSKRISSKKTQDKENEEVIREVLNEKALSVIDRINKKLNGRDFSKDRLDVSDQVNRLIEQAMSHENLSQCYVGWCPFW